MSDDSTPPRPKSWLHRFREFIQAEPQDREQLLDTLRDAAERTLIDRDTLGMLEGVLSVAELRVRDIMVPRAQMICVDIEAELADIVPLVVEAGHSRYPVVGDDRDQIEGVLLAKDLLPFAQVGGRAEAGGFDLRAILRPALMVPESKRLDVLLREFRQNRNHMAIVVDEYGGVAGLVTIEDILEQIVGDIEDEYDFDAEEDYLRQLAPNEFHVRADMPVEDFNEAFAVAFDEESFDTVGGVVLHAFGHLPARGEQVLIDNLDFTVLAGDSRRVKLLRVRRRPASTRPAAETP